MPPDRLPINARSVCAGIQTGDMASASAERSALVERRLLWRSSGSALAADALAGLAGLWERGLLAPGEALCGPTNTNDSGSAHGRSQSQQLIGLLGFKCALTPRAQVSLGAEAVQQIGQCRPEAPVLLLEKPGFFLVQVA